MMRVCTAVTGDAVGGEILDDTTLRCTSALYFSTAALGTPLCTVERRPERGAAVIVKEAARGAGVPLTWRWRGGGHTSDDGATEASKGCGGGSEDQSSTLLKLSRAAAAHLKDAKRSAIFFISE